MKICRAARVAWGSCCQSGSVPFVSNLTAYLDENRERFQRDLLEWLRIPSISADPAHRGDVAAAADWVAQQLTRIGMTSELVETDGHPLVYAESPPVPGAATALVYGHYDVQPPDPLQEWISPPFEPSLRDGNVYARGATDDKGQLLTHLKSVQGWMETAGSLPLQVKFLIEGEEEVGSPSLASYIDGHRDKLACDCVVISDTSQFAPGQPAITYGLRGIVYYELRFQGPKQDLHSGTFGGAVTNPLNSLTEVLASLVDGDGRIQIPGFYDDVIPLSDREREQFQALPFDDSRFQQQLGVAGLSGESSYSTLERRWARPSFDINGIWGGYQGQGAKTVLPARGTAKFSFRLVPAQDPERITASLNSLLSEALPPGIEFQLDAPHGAPGIVFSLDSPYINAAAVAIEKGFGRWPVFIREGGSIPIVTQLAHSLGADVLLLGWGLDDDNTHSPNEKFSLADFHRGTKASAQLWRELAKIDPEEQSG